jgi:DNA-directed RNA polymerase beta subunit
MFNTTLGDLCLNSVPRGSLQRGILCKGFASHINCKTKNYFRTSFTTKHASKKVMHLLSSTRISSLAAISKDSKSNGDKASISSVSSSASLLLRNNFDRDTQEISGFPTNLEKQSVPRDITTVAAKKRINFLDSYHRSNQDTCLRHKPAVSYGEWVESGDLLADNSASMNGELAIGKNILVAYMPWEGYNYEDAILINERLVYDDVYTSVHIERYEIETKENQLGTEKITRDIPDVASDAISHLDNYGIAKVGTWISEGDILVGKVTPIAKKKQTPYQRLLFKLLDRSQKTVRESSLRAPKGMEATVINVQIVAFEPLDSPKDTEISKQTEILVKRAKLTKLAREKVLSGAASDANPEIQHGHKHKRKRTYRSKLVQLKSLKTTSSLSSALNLLNNSGLHPTLSHALSPAQGKKSSKHKLTPQQAQANVGRIWSCTKTPPVSRMVFETNKGEKKLPWLATYSSIDKQNRFDLPGYKGLGKSFLNKLKTITPLSKQYQGKNVKYTQSDMCFQTLKTTGKAKNPFSISGYVEKPVVKYSNVLALYREVNQNRVKNSLKSSLLNKKNVKNSSNLNTQGPSIQPTGVHVYLAEKRKIQVGDKMAGRHGNKGIISNILPRQDMPFLPDGTAVDIVLNPLGVPSRMNVGQIYECLLGLAGKYLGEHYKILPFDEIYGPEASRSFVFAKLLEASKKTGIEWLFDPNTPGKMRLFDGRTFESFDQPVTVGVAYMLKLVHMVDDKLHMRSSGPYSLVTQQPLRGRAKQGGQRLGEMEVWAIEGYGAAFILLEMLTVKSDDMSGRQTLWAKLILNKELDMGTPESFKVLVCELQALCLDIGLFSYKQSRQAQQKAAKSKKARVSQADSHLVLKEISHIMLLP